MQNQPQPNYQAQPQQNYQGQPQQNYQGQPNYDPNNPYTQNGANPNNAQVMQAPMNMGNPMMMAPMMMQAPQMELPSRADNARQSVMVRCLACNKVGNSQVSKTCGTRTIICCILFPFWPLICAESAGQPCWTVVSKCPNCNAEVGKADC